MTCDHIREMLSAQIDGEVDADEEAVIDAHLLACPACRAYRDDAWALRRALRMRAVDTATQASPSAAPPTVAGSLRGVSFLRYALFVIGGTLVIVNVEALLTTDGSTAQHLSRHDAVFGTALGIGMLAVALKPHRAIGLVPITSAIAGLMLIVGVTDLIAGNASLVDESIHVVEFIGLVCLWVISGGPSRISHRLAAVRHFVRARRGSSVAEWPTA